MDYRVPLKSTEPLYEMSPNAGGFCVWGGGGAFEPLFQTPPSKDVLEEGGGGVWDPKACVPKTALQDQGVLHRHSTKAVKLNAIANYISARERNVVEIQLVRGHSELGGWAG